MTGQPQLGTMTNAIGIDCTKLDVLDTGGIQSNLIVERGKDFQVRTQFRMDGLFADWIVSLRVPFTVTYYYESIGGGPEGTLATKSGNTVAGQLRYEAETVATANLATVGTYKLTVVITFGGGPPMTAFMEGPMIQVF